MPVLGAINYVLSLRVTHPKAFHERFEHAIENLPLGMCLYDGDERLQLVNERFCTIYKQPMERLRSGMTFYEILSDSCAVGNYPGQTADQVYSLRKTFIDEQKPGIFRQQLGDGRLIKILHQPLRGGGWVCTYEDITENRRARSRIEFLALHDSLTELANRSLFADKLQEAIAQASDERPASLLCFDLDGFKRVNDRLGHGAGDALLKEVAQRLIRHSPENATPARLGGDEFAVVLPRGSRDEALQLAHRLSIVIREPYNLGESGRAVISTSIGIASAPCHAGSYDKLLLLADRALYLSKNGRRGEPVYFEPTPGVAVRDEKLVGYSPALRSPAFSD